MLLYRNLMSAEHAPIDHGGKKGGGLGSRGTSRWGSGADEGLREGAGVLWGSPSMHLAVLYTVSAELKARIKPQSLRSPAGFLHTTDVDIRPSDRTPVGNSLTLRPWETADRPSEGGRARTRPSRIKISGDVYTLAWCDPA